MRRPLSSRDWRELIDSIELRLMQIIAVNKELRRRNALDTGRGYPSNSMGGTKSSDITDRTGTLAVMAPEDDPVLDAQLHIERVLLHIDKELNVPLSQALTLPNMHEIKIKTLGQFYAANTPRGASTKRVAEWRKNQKLEQ